MSPFKHLLSPLDPGALAEPAMGTGIALARQLGASINAFVAETPAPAGAVGHGAQHYLDASQAHASRVAHHAQGMLWAFEARAEAAGVPFVGVYAQTAHIDAAIADAARQEGCDLIIMVTHARGRFDEWRLGSCTKAVMSRCDLPLLVLR